jgi:photosystem II oxygen-evolving enhancer protein 2
VIAKGKEIMLKRIAAVLLVVLSMSLAGCVTATGGLNSYVDTIKGYQFLYPNGWVQVKVSNGPDIVFHDIIEQTENASLIISPVPDGKSLTQLGTPGEVGYKLSKNAIAPPESGRTAELVNAEAKEVGDKTYYLFEYAVKLPNQQERHNLASVAVSRGKLFTFNISTTEKRWEQVAKQLEIVANSFSVD